MSLSVPDPSDVQPEMSVEEQEAALYALDVLVSARVLVDQALCGHRDAEDVIRWLRTYSSNAAMTYRWAHEAA